VCQIVPESWFIFTPACSGARLRGLGLCHPGLLHSLEEPNPVLAHPVPDEFSVMLKIMSIVVCPTSVPPTTDLPRVPA